MITLITGYLDNNQKIVDAITLRATLSCSVIEEHPHCKSHPKIQYEWVYNICKTDNAIILSNSDHILNGILVAIHDGITDRNNVEVFYVSEDGNVLKIEITEDCRIIYPPKGFFDQTSIARKKLLGF